MREKAIKDALWLIPGATQSERYQGGAQFFHRALGRRAPSK